VHQGIPLQSGLEDVAELCQKVREIVHFKGVKKWRFMGTPLQSWLDERKFGEMGEFLHGSHSAYPDF